MPLRVRPARAKATLLALLCCSCSALLLRTTALSVCNGVDTNPPGGNGAKATNYYAGDNATQPLPPLGLDAATEETMRGTLQDVVSVWLEQMYPPSFGDPVWGSYNFNGASGRALLANRLYQNSGFDKKYLRAALQYLEGSLNRTQATSEVGFLKGLVGIQALAAVTYVRAQELDKADMMIAKVTQTFKEVAMATNNEAWRGDRANPVFDFDEGIAGLLFCELFMRANLARIVIDPELVGQVATILYELGVSSQNATSGEMTFFSTEEGEGVGSGGALTMLFNYVQLLPDGAEEHLRQAVDFVASQQQPDGGMPSDRPDRVQWCHGTPGFIGLFIKAYQTFGDESYLQVAAKAANFTEINGVILKGNLVGHGAAGNSYLVMAMFMPTQDPIWLRKAVGMQMVALNSSIATDSYSCISGSAWLDGNGGSGFIFSDLVATANDPTRLGELAFAMPAYGEAVWDYGYLELKYQ